MIYDRGKKFGQDNIVIIYKDLETGEKLVHSIDRPMIEVYIVKPEFRNYSYVKNFIDIESCYPLRVHYASRWTEIAKEMGLAGPDEAKTSPYVFGADIQIENYYMMQFEYEYHTDKKKELSRGYFDIENDTINLDRFPQYGETPINAITYVDDSTQNVFLFVNVKNNMTPLPKDHPKYALFQELSERFDKASAWLQNHPKEFIQRCHDLFDESYPGMTYNLLIFDEEIALIKAFWDIVHASSNDFCSAWNIPYDMQNLMLRPITLGYDPNTIIPEEWARGGIGSKHSIYFYEDNNPVVHKKKHQIVTYTKTSFVDDMINYAGIRSGRGKLASNKLNFAARKELRDEKLDYSEAASIRTFAYEDFIKFLLYNIKDTLLLVGIGRHTGDMDTIYGRMYSSMILPKDAFTTTTVVLGALRSFIYKRGWVVGPNKNKFAENKNKKNPNYAEIVTKFSDDDSGDIDDLFFGDLSDDDDEDGDGKREKYDGAFVANTLHMKPTGYEIMGQPSQFVHRYIGDEDITSEYPTAIIICNISNDTLIGKVYLEDPDKFTIPVYKSFHFRGSDESEYKLDISNFMLEAYSERDVFTFGNVFLSLPSIEKVLDEFSVEDLDNMEA